MADIRNGAIDGTHLTFDRFDASGRATPYKGELAGDELTVQLVNPPAAVPGRGGRGPQGPTVLKKVSEETEYKVAPALAHKPLPPFKPIPANGYAKTPPMGWNSWNKFAPQSGRHMPCAAWPTPWSPAACATPATSTSTSTTPGKAERDAKTATSPPTKNFPT